MAGSYIYGAPSYVRQDEDGNSFATSGVSTNDSSLFGGAAKYLKTDNTGQIQIVDTGTPIAIKTINKKTGKEFAKWVAKTVKDDDSKIEIPPTPSGLDKLTSPVIKAQNEMMRQDAEDRDEDDSESVSED